MVGNWQLAPLPNGVGGVHQESMARGGAMEGWPASPTPNWCKRGPIRGGASQVVGSWAVGAGLAPDQSGGGG